MTLKGLLWLAKIASAISILDSSGEGVNRIGIQEPKKLP